MLLISILLLYLIYFLNINIINRYEGFILNNVDNSVYINDNIENINIMINDIQSADNSEDTDGTNSSNIKKTHSITSTTLVKTIDYMKRTNTITIFIRIT